MIISCETTWQASPSPSPSVSCWSGFGTRTQLSSISGTPTCWCCWSSLRLPSCQTSPMKASPKVLPCKQSNILVITVIVVVFVTGIANPVPKTKKTVELVGVCNIRTVVHLATLDDHLVDAFDRQPHQELRPCHDHWECHRDRQRDCCPRLLDQGLGAEICLTCSTFFQNVQSQ